MVDQQLCKDCGHRQSCQAVYEAMSGHKGPSVTLRVVVVFLVPMLVFIGSLVIAEKIMADLVVAGELRTLLSFLVAILATLAWICAVKKLGASMGFNL